MPCQPRSVYWQVSHGYPETPPSCMNNVTMTEWLSKFIDGSVQPLTSELAKSHNGVLTRFHYWLMVTKLTWCCPQNELSTDYLLVFYLQWLSMWSSFRFSAELDHQLTLYRKYRLRFSATVVWTFFHCTGLRGSPCVKKTICCIQWVTNLWLSAAFNVNPQC